MLSLFSSLLITGVSAAIYNQMSTSMTNQAEISPVVFTNGQFSVSDWDMVISPFSKCADCEIVGNIYQNEELLNERTLKSNQFKELPND